jgi:hypothetical protein
VPTGAPLPEAAPQPMVQMKPPMLPSDWAMHACCCEIDDNVWQYWMAICAGDWYAPLPVKGVQGAPGGGAFTAG